MTKSNKNFGAWGESAATEYLENKGYQVISRNLHTPYGEIDIVAENENKLMFIEVKTRSNKSYGNPEDSINPRKLEHMEASAQFYVQNCEYQGTWQIDVISILKRDSNQLEIVHFENVIN